MNKLILLLFIGIVFVLVGFFSAQSMSKKMLGYEDCENWPTVNGQISEINIERSSSRTSKGTSTSYLPVIDYKYYINNVEYKETTKRIIGKSFSTKAKAESYLNKISNDGVNVKVYYNAEDISVSVLDPKGIKSNFVMSIFVFSLFLGLGTILIMFSVILFLRKTVI